MYSLLLVFLLPTLGIPFVYMLGKKSAKFAAMLIAAIVIINMVLLLSTVPTVLDSPDHRYVESYAWIPILGAEFTLFVDGISVSIALISLILILSVAIFSINYMEGKQNLPAYYALLSMLSIGLVGVFITSNLLLFYFCWELMLVPAYFIVGGWGYREPYRAAFKLFVFTHAGAVFVLLGIGALFMLTGSTDMFQVQNALMSADPEIVKWILLSLTGGFAVKMAIVPVHMWLPDAHSEAPSTMSALLSGVIISAGAYAVLRLSLGTVFPSVMGTEFGVTFLHGLAFFGVFSAFFGSLIALVENDIKRIIAYSSIAHMGYVMFGLSLFPFSEATTGTVLHLVNHAVSKGLFFLTAGTIMHQLNLRDIRKMGGLAGKLPLTATTSIIAALSIAGTPPFAIFISEFLIFVGAFQVITTDSFYLLPTFLMLVATVLSLSYSLRFVSNVFFGQSKTEGKVHAVPIFMKIALVILALIVILLGIWPSFFIDLISTVSFV